MGNAHSFLSYPESRAPLNIKRQWVKELGTDPLVSISAVMGELWVLSRTGHMYVLRPPSGSDLSGQNQVQPENVRGSPIKLNLRTTQPPAHIGGLWFIIGEQNEARIIKRHIRTTEDVTTWKVLKCEIPRTWTWEGWPLAVVGTAEPTFAVLARDEDHGVHLTVFEVPSATPSSHETMQPTATIRLERCNTVPVQMPLTAANDADTKQALRTEYTEQLLGALLWVAFIDQLAALAVYVSPGRRGERNSSAQSHRHDHRSARRPGGC